MTTETGWLGVRVADGVEQLATRLGYSGAAAGWKQQHVVGSGHVAGHLLGVFRGVDLQAWQQRRQQDGRSNTWSASGMLRATCLGYSEALTYRRGSRAIAGWKKQHVVGNRHAACHLLGVFWGVDL